MTGPNGGAIGILESNFKSVDNVYKSNQALGHDGNHNIQSSGCPIYYNQYQIGSGGSAGAVYLDGQIAQGPQFCGDLYSQNHGGVNALGGAILGAGDPGTQYLTISQTEFDQNSNNNGGAIYAYKNQLVITDSTFSGNRANYGGAIQTNLSTITATNNTFSGNVANTTVGVLAIFGGSGVLQNNTFVGNQAPHYPIVFEGSSSNPPPALNFTGNIFSNNLETAGSTGCYVTFAGGHNVVWPASKFTPAPEAGCATAQTENPFLNPLAYNGGFTETMSIPVNSPANRMSTPCPATDQRGQARSTPCAAGSYQP